MKIKKNYFGTLATGEDVHLYTLKAGDLSLSLSTFGGILVSLIVPSRLLGKDDVLLGFSTLGPYTRHHPYFGATVGRVANRIAKGRFELGGKTYDLYKNNGENSLHGGRRGFDRRVWKAEAYEEKGGVYLRLSLKSRNGDEGFPGEMQATVSYGLRSDNVLVADYRAKLDAPCPVNLTNHAYFNLKGEGRGDVLGHELILNASSYLPVDSTLIPTGQLAKCAGSPFDFLTRKSLGQDIKEAGGYDHNFVIDGEPGKMRSSAEVFEPLSGRTMRQSTTQPGVQLYTGNFLDNIQGKLGSIYNKHSGFCLETQHFPDSPNQEKFPDAIFGPDRKYHEHTEFAFDW
ncbi:galactose mutarotase [Treponema sp.]